MRCKPFSTTRLSRFRNFTLRFRNPFCSPLISIRYSAMMRIAPTRRARTWNMRSRAAAVVCEWIRTVEEPLNVDCGINSKREPRTVAQHSTLSVVRALVSARQLVGRTADSPRGYVFDPESWNFDWVDFSIVSVDVRHLFIFSRWWMC